MNEKSVSNGSHARTIKLQLSLYQRAEIECFRSSTILNADFNFSTALKINHTAALGFSVESIPIF